MKLSQKNLLDFFLICTLVLLSTFATWFPFLFKINDWFGLQIPHSDFSYIYKNYDGPLYIVVAKTLYNITSIENLKLELPFAPIYFSAHLPLYPLLIKLFYPLFGYLQSMVFVNLLSTIGLALFFYYFLKKLNLSQKPIILIVIFIMLPRFLIVRSIGAPESIFIFLILASIYFFELKRYLLAGLFGGLATITKTPGILLFFAFFFAIINNFLRSKKINLNWLFIFLIPLFLLGVFLIYAGQYGSLYAYFNQDSFVPLVFPFSVFNFRKEWVQTPWLEEIIFYFFLYFLAVFNLKNIKYKIFFYFSLIFFIATTFIQHRDISRYSLPLWPFACIAFEKFFTSKKFLLAFIILLPAIYFFTWNYISYNTLPISDWRPFI